MQTTEKEIVFQAEHVSKMYRFNVLNDLSLTVYRGDIYGFVGRNGAGKTTLMRMGCGLVRPTKGSVSLFGNVWTGKGACKTQGKIAAMIETPMLNMGMTAEQNLKLQCQLYQKSEQCIPELLQLVNLPMDDRRSVSKFSLGMRQRLSLAMVLVSEPELLFLDEPTEGLDPAGVMMLREVILKINREKGTTIIISSHILSELSKVATRYGFIESGRLLKEISAEELEKSCTSYYRLRVYESQKVAEFLRTKGYDAKMNPDHVDVYGVEEVTALLQLLSEHGITVYGFDHITAGLEDYFMRLLRGEV